MKHPILIERSEYRWTQFYCAVAFLILGLLVGIVFGAWWSSSSLREEYRIRHSSMQKRIDNLAEANDHMVGVLTSLYGKDVSKVLKRVFPQEKPKKGGKE